jgi:hypothetical protein
MINENFAKTYRVYGEFEDDWLYVEGYEHIQRNEMFNLRYENNCLSGKYRKWQESFDNDAWADIEVLQKKWRENGWNEKADYFTDETCGEGCCFKNLFTRIYNCGIFHRKSKVLFV